MNRTKIYLTACLIAFATMGFANEKNLEKRVNLYSGNQNIYHLVYTPFEKGKVTVSILDENGIEIMNESIKQREGFKRKYDLSTVKPGKYYFIIEDGTGKSTKMVNISRNFKVDMDQIGDFVSLTAYNHDQELLVNIYNDKDQLMATDRMERTKYSRKNYDISALEGENLHIEIVDDKGIVKSFSLQK